MSRLELINKAKAAGFYNQLVKESIISISINCWVEMCDYFNTRLIVNQEFDDCKGRSYTETSEAFNVSEMTIRRAVKFMEQ